VVKSSKGFRSRTRGSLTKEVRERGVVPPSRYLRSFPVGSHVIVRLEPSDPHGMPHPRYQGKVCEVRARRGRCYELVFRDGGKTKILVANPVHLIPAGGETPGED
jgi:large subunit ribosomal protein L21e